MTEQHVIAMIDAGKRELCKLHEEFLAGLSPDVSLEVSCAMLHRTYLELCAKELLQPINHMLEPTSVELQARFGLDCLFKALEGGCDQADARKAFWSKLYVATRLTTLRGAGPGGDRGGD